jgi:DNA-binding winged helix-turn-helix (wHTH) protein/TolB-like protein/tetratricopeptide (TPR) repeat protein
MKGFKALMDGQRKQSYSFGAFRLDTRERLLLRNGEPVSLPPKVYDTLLALVESSGHIIEKEELMKTVWPDTFVEDANLTVNISALRRALGEGVAGHQYIETVPRRGYRFVSPVTREENESLDWSAEERHTTRTVIAEKTALEAEEKPSPAKGSVRLPHSRRFGAAVVGLSLLLAGLSAIAFYTWRKRAEPEPKVRSIAVLPFKPLVADSRDEPLEMGMCDALITRLSGLKQLAVRSTSSVVMYNRPGQDPLTAGRELGVDALLDGYVQRSGDKIRVTVQLLNIKDGKHLWSGQFNENFTDIFAVEDSISRQMVEALLKLTGEEQQRVTRHPTDNVDAYEDYLKGRYFLDKATPEGVKKSIQHFQQATEKDLKYALAFAGLAEAYIIQGVRFDMPPQESFQKAKTAALRAIEIDDTNAEAHMALAHIRCWYDWDWLGAESEFKRAIQLSHNHPIETQYYVSYLIAMGRLQEAASEIRQAQRLAPLSLSINVQLARTLYFARQYDEAIEQCRKTLELEPDFGGARFFLGRLYKQKGMYREALAELEKARELLRDNRASDLLRDNAEVLSIIGYTYAASGHRAEALKILQELQEQATQRYVSPYHMAMVYTGLGERDKAFSWLGKAFDDREGRMTILKVVPEFDSLRSDPRFADLLRRIGLP